MGEEASLRQFHRRRINRSTSRRRPCHQYGDETARVGGILLIIGLLHGLNILIMPVLGRLPCSARPPG